MMPADNFDLLLTNGVLKITLWSFFHQIVSTFNVSGASL